MLTSGVRNAPSEAKGVVCVDFDGTIMEWGPLEGPFTPLPGAREALTQLKQAGHTIAVFTSRLSQRWLAGRSEEAQYNTVYEALSAAHIPFTLITGEKIPAEWYIDDLAIPFRGDWAEVIQQILGSTAHGEDKEVRVTSPTGGQKGLKAAQIGALDPLALLAVGEVAGYGTKKYSRYNFLKGYDWSLSFDALMRHALAFWGGEDLDTESGLPHPAHAAWHAMALTSFMGRGLGSDDRPARKLEP